MEGTAAQMIQYRRGVLLRYVKYRNRRLVPASGDTIAGLCILFCGTEVVPRQDRCCTDLWFAGATRTKFVFFSSHL
jgi:hypothetical protein